MYLHENSVILNREQKKTVRISIDRSSVAISTNVLSELPLKKANFS